MVLTEKGAIFSCGDNEHYECGVYGPQKIKSLRKLKIEDKIVDIQCGTSHNLCLTEKGNLYVFGLNNHHQLGMSQPEKSPLVKCKFFWDNNIRLVSINAGGWHNICMDNKGKCWGFGWSEYAQLGVDKKHNPPKKMKIGGKGCKIEQISLGPWHSLFLGVDNNVYTCGFNSSGECSIVYEQKKKIYPAYHLKREEIGVDEDCRIAAVIAGYQSTLIIVED